MNHFSDNPYESPFQAELSESRPSPKPLRPFPVAATAITAFVLLVCVMVALNGWDLMSLRDDISLVVGLVCFVPGCIGSFICCLLLIRYVLK
jgi:hypothetical protein